MADVICSHRIGVGWLAMSCCILMLLFSFTMTHFTCNLLWLLVLKIW